MSSSLHDIISSDNRHGLLLHRRRWKNEPRMFFMYSPSSRHEGSGHQCRAVPGHSGRLLRLRTVPPQPTPEPVYSYRPSTFERSWSAAQDAMEDVGVRIVSADRNSGIIRGTRDAVDATVTVRTQADGRVRVEFNARGPSGQDPHLADRIYQAYERRMGR